MLYDFDIAAIAQRNVPRWFRHAKNAAFIRVIARGLAWIHTEFLAWRQDTIIDQYRFNGLVHSLEWVLNDRFDAVARRIKLQINDEVPFYYLQDNDGQMVFALEDGMLANYYCLEETMGTVAPVAEFFILVPTDIALNTDELFDLVDLYRFAGRRPRIVWCMILGGNYFPTSYTDHPNQLPTYQ